VTRPVALTVNVAGIHEVFRRECRWATWRYRLDGTRWTKVPVYPATSDDRTTWRSLADVLAVYQTGHVDGISFALGDGYGGVDVDKYLGHECNLIEHIPGRRERSPGALGIKIIGRCERIGGQIDFVQEPPTFTRWSSPRFFAMTGQDASGDPLADLSAFINEWFPAPIVLPSTREGYASAAEMDDEMLWAQMLGGGDEQSDKRLALFRGDTSAYGGDHSRADFALVAHLAWWTNFDADRIDRMFRQSGLVRDKWTKTASYRKATIGKALR
jgi:primase-polymerase (primpol)-like protein